MWNQLILVDFCRHTGNKQLHEMVCNSRLPIATYKLTTVSTQPGFWMRSAFTTWNTSTMPSVLQHSVALMREQNTPHRLTVSLHAVQITCAYVCVQVMCVCVLCVQIKGKINQISKLANYRTYKNWVAIM